VLPSWARRVAEWPAFASIYGGRACGKTTAIARLLVLRAAVEPARIMCARAVQASIRDSALHEVETAIGELGLSAAFEVGRTEVRSAAGAVLRFHGLDRQRASIKGWSRFQVCWIEEAQAVPEEVWHLLEPTIRAPGSSLVATWNPATRRDWIWRRSVEAPEPADVVVGPLTWLDNPAWPGNAERFGLPPLAEVEARRERMERTDPALHDLHWRGLPDDGDAGRHVLTRAALRACVDAWRIVSERGMPETDTGGGRIEAEAGLDVADGGEDSNALAIRRGPLVERVEAWPGDRHNPDPAAIRALRACADAQAERLHVDATGVGSGMVGALKRLLPEHGRTERYRSRVYHRPAVEGVMFGEVPFNADKRWRGVKQGRLFKRRNSQLAWTLRTRAEKSERFVAGDTAVVPSECLLIPAGLPNLDRLLALAVDRERPCLRAA